MAIETREQKVEKLASIKAEAEALKCSYNDAFQNNKPEEYVPIANQLTEKVNAYTALAREIVFDDCKITDDPMKTACTMLTFMTIAIKDEQKPDDKFPIRTIVEKEKAIDLIKLDTYCSGIGKDKNWMHIVQKINFLLTAQKAVDLGIDVKSVNDSYTMSAIAREIDMGKTPTSKTNMLKTLQQAITAMLGDEYKATSHDVNFLMSVYSKKGKKALTVSCANHKNFTGYIAEICHRIITNKQYELEYKRDKA